MALILLRLGGSSAVHAKNAEPSIQHLAGRPMTDVREVQFAKAEPPMVRSESGKCMDTREVHSRKVDAPISQVVSARVTLARERHPRNASQVRTVTPEGRLAAASPERPKAFVWTSVRLSGRSMDWSAVHLQKANEPMLVQWGGKRIAERHSQSAKVREPILITVSGIVSP